MHKGEFDEEGKAGELVSWTRRVRRPSWSVGRVDATCTSRKMQVYVNKKKTERLYLRVLPLHQNQICI